MHQSFTKMIHFTRLVKTDGRLREFNFKINKMAGDNIYDVDTADDRGNRLFFKMHKPDGQWRVTEGTTLPSWIINYEDALAEELQAGIAEF